MLHVTGFQLDFVPKGPGHSVSSQCTPFFPRSVHTPAVMRLLWIPFGEYMLTIDDFHAFHVPDNGFLD